MNRLKIADSYERSEMITEDYDRAVSDKNWERALELNEPHYREAINRYLTGDCEDRVCAMKELKELSKTYSNLINKLNNPEEKQ